VGSPAAGFAGAPGNAVGTGESVAVAGALRVRSMLMTEAARA